MKSQDRIKKIEKLYLLANEADALGLRKQADELDKVAGILSWITGNKASDTAGGVASSSGSIVGGIGAMLGGGMLGSGVSKMLRNMGWSEEAAATVGGVVGLAPSFIPGGFLAKIGIGAATAAIGWALDKFMSSHSESDIPEGIWHDALAEALEEVSEIEKSKVNQEAVLKVDKLEKLCHEVASAQNATEQEKAYASNMLTKIDELKKKLPVLMAHAIDQAAESKGVDVEASEPTDDKPEAPANTDPWGEVVKALHERDASKYPYGINDEQAMAAMKELGATGNAVSDPTAALDWLKQNH